ncbi:heme exporter protein CcmD [Neptunomonas concharum]|uniref:Heme exporter protein D n=1 Tax=Neptunomonas concharum TaxID=1031538 RepID=A0A5P1R960_9GAMM|nr:heme exporter protein CcmD [Neptunomonas concharum]QEQ95825.1 heme exporter protein CcmD [Neptunomonas concharum]
MQFESFSEFLNMGGHGLYVWLSYALGIAIISANLILPVFKRKELLKNLARRLRRENNAP